MRMSLILCLVVASAMTSMALAQLQSFMWDPKSRPDISGGIYSVDYYGSVGNSWIYPNSFISAASAHPEIASAVGGGVAVIFDPTFVGYNLSANNAVITGVFLVSVTANGGITYTGQQWVTSQQVPVGSLRCFDLLNFAGASNPLTPGPANLASAPAPTPDNRCSVGLFNPSIETLAIAPVITPVDPTKPFGVVVVPVVVPEPASVAALIIGGIGLLRFNRRK